jgi:hypothetical protein
MESSALSDVKVDVSTLPISSIVVYQTRATLSRPFSVNAEKLPVGRRSIIVEGFNQEKTIEDSVRITADANTLSAVVIEQNIRYHEQKHDEEQEKKDDEPFVENIRKLNDQKTVLQRELTRTQDARRDLKKTVTEREKLHAGKRGIDFLLENVQWEALESTLSDLSTRVEVFDSRDGQIQGELKLLQRELDKVQKELDDIRKKRQEYRNNTQYLSKTFNVTLILDVFEQSTTDIQFNLDYAVKDCSWTPSYDVRIVKSQHPQRPPQQPYYEPTSSRKKKASSPPSLPQTVDRDLVDLELTCYGSVKQITGQDWRSEEMKLCTIDPTVGSQPPDLDNQNLYFTLPPRTVGSIVRGWFSGIGFGSQKRHVEDELHETRLQMEKNLGAQQLPDSTQSRATGSAVHHFEVPGRFIHVPSDGLAHRVLLFKTRIEGCIRMHYSVPKLSQDAFVQVRCEESDLDVPLLPGTVQVFDDKNFVCNAALQKAINPREAFDLYLGVNTNVRVQYLPVKRTNSTSSSILKGKHTKCLVERVTIIKNAQDTQTEITLADQLPKSVEHFIVVKLEKPVSLANELEQSQQVMQHQNGQPYLNDKNNIQWDRIPLGPGAEVRLELTYSVEWPTEKKLNVEDL